MEGWAMGIPALVNGKCNVLAGQCKRSNGGLWYQNIEKFKACLDRLLVLTWQNSLARMAMPM